MAFVDATRRVVAFVDATRRVVAFLQVAIAAATRTPAAFLDVKLAVWPVEAAAVRRMLVHSDKFGNRGDR